MLVLALAACGSSSIREGRRRSDGDENSSRIADALGPARSQSMNLVALYATGTKRKLHRQDRHSDDDTITSVLENDADS